jgi:hypothetical protein
MHGGKDLNRRSEQGVVADAHSADVEHNAIEVEEYTISKLYVGSVIAVKGRLHPHGLPSLSEQLRAEISSYFMIPFARNIERQAKVASAVSGFDKLWVEGIVKLTCQHLLALSPHLRSLRNTSSRSFPPHDGG